MSLIEDMVVLVVARTVADGHDRREQIAIAKSLVRNAARALREVAGVDAAQETIAAQLGGLERQSKRVPSGGRCRK